MHNNTNNDNSQRKQDDNQGKTKNRVFVPVTLKMVADAQPRPDDVCEIDGEAINDVSIPQSLMITIIL